MDTELMLDVGQANELKLAFRRTGWTNADIKKLCEDDTLAQLLPVVKGCVKIILTKHIIDCDAEPFLPSGWKVQEHRKGGQLEWDPAKVMLYLSENQKHDTVIVGNKLRKELKTKPALNANVLDYLLAHSELIPEEWKDGLKYFWGTICRRPDGRLCVRCLCWGGAQWRWYCSWLERGWRSSRPAVLLASSL